MTLGVEKIETVGRDEIVVDGIKKWKRLKHKLVIERGGESD